MHKTQNNIIHYNGVGKCIKIGGAPIAITRSRFYVSVHFIKVYVE